MPDAPPLGVEDDLDTIESHGILRLAAKDVAQGPKHVRGGCIRGDEDIFIFLVLLGLLLFLFLSACWLTTRLLGSFLLLLLLDSKGPAESEISSLFGVTCSAGPGIVRSFFLDAKNLDTSKSQLLRPDRLPSTARIKRFDDVCEVLRESPAVGTSLRNSKHVRSSAFVFDRMASKRLCLMSASFRVPSSNMQ